MKLSRKLKEGTQRKPRKLGRFRHSYSYQQLTYNSVTIKWLSRGMPPPSRRHTRHSIGNGWGTSPRHASPTHLVTIYQINTLYHLLMHYQTCLSKRIQLLYVRQSYTRCSICWGNLLFIQYDIHSNASSKQRVRKHKIRQISINPDVFNSYKEIKYIYSVSYV